MRGVQNKTCPECNIQFECGGNCWCNAYPPIMSVTPDNKGCFCPKCLHELMVNKVNDYMKNLTPEDEEKIVALGPVTTPVIDIDYVIDQHGVKQYTRWYQLRNQSVTN